METDRIGQAEPLDGPDTILHVSPLMRIYFRGRRGGDHQAEPLIMAAQQGERLERDFKPLRRIWPVRERKQPGITGNVPSSTVGSRLSWRHLCTWLESVGH